MGGKWEQYLFVQNLRDFTKDNAATRTTATWSLRRLQMRTLNGLALWLREVQRRQKETLMLYTTFPRTRVIRLAQKQHNHYDNEKYKETTLSSWCCLLRFERKNIAHRASETPRSSLPLAGAHESFFLWLLVLSQKTECCRQGLAAAKRQHDCRHTR